LLDGAFLTLTDPLAFYLSNCHGKSLLSLARSKGLNCGGPLILCSELEKACD
jgi:hypothetical protein